MNGNSNQHNHNHQQRNINNNRIFTTTSNYQKSSIDNNNFGSIPYSQEEQFTIQHRLNKVLGPEYVSYRPSGGNQKVQYIEGWKALNLANEIFGFNGWNSQVISCNVDYFDTHNNSGKYSLGISIIVRVTLKDGTFHEDIGYGYIDNAKSRPMAFEKCRKEALTDGLKRCLRCFGNVLGNCLYDKSIVKQMKKIETEQVEYELDNFHRDPLLIERERKKLKQEEQQRIEYEQKMKLQQEEQQRIEYEQKMKLQQEKLEKAKLLAKQHQEKMKSKDQNTFITPKSPSKILNLPPPSPPPPPQSQPRDDNVPDDEEDSFLFSDDINEDIFDKQSPRRSPRKQLQQQQQQQQEQPSEIQENTPPTSTSVQIGFVPARSANLLQCNKINELKEFDTSFIPQSIRHTIDQKRSFPIKRSDISLITTTTTTNNNNNNALKPNHLHNRINKPSINPLNIGNNKILTTSSQQDIITFKRPVIEDINNDIKRPHNE
ncbi:unnamed protein product [Candida verbasci]|uniref:DNA repair and recombination protein RAD52 n=1 Tax=Candida verbasci TaxID=1227364 RepID=A0A9W4TYM9_9ASCO|nr:unnamed protein product [Candida verbasci]